MFQLASVLYGYKKKGAYSGVQEIVVGRLKGRPEAIQSELLTGPRLLNQLSLSLFRALLTMSTLWLPKYTVCDADIFKRRDSHFCLESYSSSTHTHSYIFSLFFRLSTVL
jgi:hypothetical protein